MLSYLQDLLYDRASAANFIRGTIFLAATIVPNLVNVGSEGYWIAEVLKGAALFIRAGDKNPKPQETPA